MTADDPPHNDVIVLSLRSFYLPLLPRILEMAYLFLSWGLLALAWDCWGGRGGYRACFAPFRTYRLRLPL